MIEGELEESNFGLNKKTFKNLALELNQIYHTAATIKFNLQYDKAHSINVTGTKNCLTLAQLAGKSFQRFHHIGTAYVSTLLSEGLNRSYNNTYEQTKHEAELLIKNKSSVPYTIYRPSIISGNSTTGEITSSSIVFKFLTLLSRNLLPVIPADSSASLNIIPVNNFIDKMLLLGEKQDSLGKTYQITHEENTHFKELIVHASKLLKVTPPIFIPTKQIKETPLKVMTLLEVFLPYINQSQYFKLLPHEKSISLNKPCDNVISTLDKVIKTFSNLTHTVPI